MRRHFLFPEEEYENDVGDGQTNLLRLWLARRTQILSHEHVARHIALFWDLAKAKQDARLSGPCYNEFFARVAKALLQSLNNDGATAIAHRDWLYDTESCGNGAAGGQGAMTLELFREAVMQIAELVLPVESEQSMYVSFFLELRECIAMADAQLLGDDDDDGSEEGKGPAHDDDEPINLTLKPSLSTPQLYEAVSYTLKPLRDVAKIRGAFLQKMPPGNEQLKTISGLAPPNSQQMSLKQLLLCYNPRKFALSRRFSALFAESNGNNINAFDENAKDHELFASASTTSAACNAALAAASAPTITSRVLNKESEDTWDDAIAAIQSLEQFPALRVAVAGPPHCGKTRVSKMLADKLKQRYFSIGSAMGDAIHRKRARREARAAALAMEEAASQERNGSGSADSEQANGSSEPTDEGDTSAEDTLVGPSGDSPKTDEVSSPPSQPEPVHEEDLVFSDADLDALLSGNTLSRAKCLEIFVFYVKKSLLEGVGVVMDDVHPDEIEEVIGTDYLVVLSAAKDDIQQQVQQFAIAPNTRRVYSARERAILSGDTASIEAQGFADFVRPPQEENASPPGDANDSETKAKADSEDPEVSDTSEPGEEATGGDDAAETPEDDGPESLPPEPTQAERNQIEPPDEPTLPIRSLFMESFQDRYRDYTSRVEERIAALTVASINNPKQRYHVIHVLASQSLYVILDHCVRAITGNSFGISRTNVSRRVVPIALPEEIILSGRADQIRWLLHGDWNELPIEGQWCLLPSARNGKRRLSRWKEFCPVSSRAERGLVLGDPALAVCLSGRVYSTATPEARDAFCAHPLQYLRKTPQAKPFDRIWLVSSSKSTLSATKEGGSESPLAAIASALGLPAFDAVEVLSKHTPMAVQMELMEGKMLSGVRAAELVAEAVLHSTSLSWILSNLPFTSETIAALKESECLPEMVILLDPTQELLDEQSKSYQTTGGGGIVNLKHQQFQASFGAASDMMKELGVAVKTSALYEDVDDTVAALRRQLDPLAPRVDRVEDGYIITEDVENAFAFAPTSEDEAEGEERSTKLTAPTTEKGETNQFCPVSWLEKRILIPGLPEFVAAFNFKYYSFAGKREQDAFERNPLKYLPTSYNATASLVPTIVFLGVRGSGVVHLSKGVETLANAAKYGYLIVDVDLEHTNQQLEKRLRTESLKSEEAQRSSLDLYVEELKKDLQSSVEKSQRINTQNQSGTPRPACIVLGGLGADDSRLPSAELLQICFQQDLFPILVAPLSLTEEQAVGNQLKLWKASLPERRTKLKVRRPASRDDSEVVEEEDDGEPEFNFEEAEAEEIQRLQEQFQADQEALTAAIDAFRARGITIATSTTSGGIDVSGSFRQSVSKISAEIDALMRRKDSLFDHYEIIERGTLMRGLDTGELVVGKHGTVCPVTGTAKTTTATFENTGAVQYRGRLYFPRDKDALTEFVGNPAKYISHAPSVAPGYQPTCCVTGAPLVGKTKFAKELALKYRLVYVSPRAAIDWVLQCHGATALSKRLRVSQAAGATPDAKTVDEAIVARLQSSECQLNGWVLDDFLQTPKDLQRFKENTAMAAIDPGVLFILDGNFQTIWKRKKKQLAKCPVNCEPGGANDPEAQQIKRVELAAARDLLVQQFAVWQRQRLDLLTLWSTQYGSFHVQQISATQTSLWNALAQAQERLDAHIVSMRAYRKELVAGRTARLDGVVRRIGTLKLQSHPVFQHFCTVELSSSRYSSSWATDRQHCVQFEYQCYWMASALNTQQFMENPMDFIGPEQEEEARALIQKAPLDASLLSLISVADCEFPELKGYCPVTFKLGTGAKDWTAIVKGQVFYRSSYLHKVYFFASEEMRRKFLAQPALYASQKLPVKLPPQLSTALAKNFAGKLEQELSAVLHESLLVLGSERPKFLQASVGASACFYLALILKTRAKSIPEHARNSFQTKKNAFELDCRLSEMLKAAITPSNASCGTAVKGVRAVRGSSASGICSTSSISSNTTAGQDLDVQELCRRFDAITGSCGANPSINPATVRSAFLEYTAL